MDTTTLLLIVIVVLLLGGGGFYWRGHWLYPRSAEFNARALSVRNILRLGEARGQRRPKRAAAPQSACVC
jgi:hypothetical protein